MKTIEAYKFFFISLILCFASSCDEEEPLALKNNFKLNFTSTISELARTGSSHNNAVVFTDFRISIREVKVEIVIGASSKEIEIEFEGPFDVDLLNPQAPVTVQIGNATIPTGTIEKIRFTLHKSEDWANENPLFDRSIFIAGTIKGYPFEMWHDVNEHFDFENPISFEGGTITISINFDIDDFISSIHAIDLTQARDEDRDGLIEINPDNDDGNKEIAELIKENIKAAADLVEGD